MTIQLSAPTTVDLTDPDPQSTYCRCPDPGNQYQLEIDAGSVFLTHTACGRQPDGDWWAEALQLDPLPVRVAIETDCPGAHAHHSGYPCDCNSWAQITIPAAG